MQPGTNSQHRHKHEEPCRDSRARDRRYSCSVETTPLPAPLRATRKPPGIPLSDTRQLSSMETCSELDLLLANSATRAKQNAFDHTHHIRESLPAGSDRPKVSRAVAVTRHALETGHRHPLSQDHYR